MCAYVDNIVITKTSGETTYKLFDKVLTNIEEAGLKLSGGKCLVLMSKIDYLGLHPTENQI